MKLIKGKKIINATEKTYRVIFKDLGYEVYNKVEEKQPTNEDKGLGINDITKDKIIEVLTEKGIEHNPRDKKEILYDLMIEGE